MIHKMIAEYIVCLGKEHGRITNNEEILQILLKIPDFVVRLSKAL